MVMYPPQPAEPVSAGFNEETGDPVEITVSSIYENNEHHNLMQTVMLTSLLIYCKNGDNK